MRNVSLHSKHKANRYFTNIVYTSVFNHIRTNGFMPDCKMVSDVKRDKILNNGALWQEGKHNQLIQTEAVWNIPDPYTIVPTCYCGRPVQVPSGVTCVCRHWSVNVALCLRVRAVADIGWKVAHLSNQNVYYVLFTTFWYMHIDFII